MREKEQRQGKEEEEVKGREVMEDGKGTRRG